jgi:phosphate transport system substrate-binding protein
MPNAKSGLARAYSRRLRLATLCAIVAVSAGLGTATSAQDASAEENVILSSRDDTISIQGKYLGFENGAYIVDTGRMGIMRIDAKRVNCAGAACMLALEAAQGGTSVAAEAAPAPEPAPEAAPEVAAVAEAAPEPVPEADVSESIAVAAESATAATVDPKFGIHGSRTVGTTLIPSLLQGYAAHVGASYELTESGEDGIRTVTLTNPDGTIRAEIDLQTKGSGTAIPALIDGVADIGLTDRPMNDGDVEKLTAAGLPDLRGTPDEMVLGVDGIVVILNTANPIRDISAEEVSKIFAGEITNWLELGGGDVPIKIQTYEEGSGDREVLLNGLVRPFGREETAEVTRHKGYYELVEGVIAEPGSIGYVGRWLARGNNVKLMPIREVCGLQSEPSDFRMKIEGYSLSRRLFAFKLPGDIHPEARAFLDWTQTREAQPWVTAANFVDRELERMRLEDMGMALIHTAAVEPDFSGRQFSDAMRELRGADRLSLSFRFEFGSATLDSESVKNVEALGRLIQDQDFEGLEVLLVGFADSVGDRDKNTALAQARADEVRDILVETLPADVVEKAKLIPLSYGELMPLSCNEDEAGRERNRRVEVWLRLPDSRITLR